MEWHSYFKEVFFTTWDKAGLLHPEKYTAAYVDAREHWGYYIPAVDEKKAEQAGITYNQLRSVYGFGKLTGELLCEWAGISEEKTKHIADWCGRFNLGISLFDHICDELNNKERLLTLEAVKPLLPLHIVCTPPENAVEEILNSLVASVLDDLNVNGFEQIAPVMREMLQAEYFLATTDYGANIERNKIKEALHLKSAEPFKVMALYAGIHSGLATKDHAELYDFGKALGLCYLLIDDARDLQDDAAAGHWNLFLAEDVPGFNIPPGGDLMIEFTGRLIQLKLAEQVSVETVAAFVQALNQKELCKETKERITGFTGASLWQWFSY